MENETGNARKVATENVVKDETLMVDKNEAYYKMAEMEILSSREVEISGVEGEMEMVVEGTCRYMEEG